MKKESFEYQWSRIGKEGGALTSSEDDMRGGVQEREGEGDNS